MLGTGREQGDQEQGEKIGESQESFLDLGGDGVGAGGMEKQPKPHCKQ